MRWKADFAHYSPKVVSDNGEPVAKTYSGYYLERGRSAEANAIAHLIAAAPEMLEALEMCLKATAVDLTDEELSDVAAKVISAVKSAKGD